MEPGNEERSEQAAGPADSHPATGAASGRNYSGVRITAPPRSKATGSRTLKDLAEELNQRVSPRSFGRSQQARILTGAALFGVIATVLLHEFGHWLSGWIVTGMTPDYLFVAVRQKTAEFSTFGGILTWGSGPLLHLAAVWVAVIFVTSRSRTHPRFFSAAGAAIIFTVLVHLLNWAGATFSSPESWGNDIPKVATFFGSWARFWMHVLSAAYLLALVPPVYVWFTVARTTHNQGLFITPAVIGAIQGGILVVIVTFFVSLAT